MTNEKYQFYSFFKHPNIAQGISSKVFGSMKRVDTLQIDRVALSQFAKSLGITEDVVCMKQIHGGTVTVIENIDKLQIPETDGLITNKQHIPLGVLTADCLP